MKVGANVSMHLNNTFTEDNVMAEQELNLDEVEETEPESSLRDDIEAAADTVEETPDAVEATAETETTQKTQAEVPGESAAAPVEPPAPAAAKPPVDWAPDVKEAWGDLPEGVRNAVAERERHINQTLEDTAGIRHEYDAFNQMISPYIPMIQAEGVSNPQQAIEGLLRTTAALQMGSPQQKAQKLAGLVAHYGVDIEMLDQALTGQLPAGPQAPPTDPRVDQLMARIDQADQATQNQMVQESQQSIGQFAGDPANVHFEAVRNTMADFLDVAAQSGHDMTIAEAYQRACLADPNIAPLVTQQFAQQAAQGQQAGIAGKQRAAASISGRPATGAGAAGMITDDMSLRDTIAAQLAGGSRI
jgi:hypothetical protein